MKKLVVAVLLIFILAIFLIMINNPVPKTNAAMQKSPEEIIPSGGIIHRPRPIPPHT